jgi:hypothetical protein
MVLDDFIEKTNRCSKNKQLEDESLEILKDHINASEEPDRLA